MAVPGMGDPFLGDGPYGSHPYEGMPNEALLHLLTVGGEMGVANHGMVTGRAQQLIRAMGLKDVWRLLVTPSRPADGRPAPEWDLPGDNRYTEWVSDLERYRAQIRKKTPNPQIPSIVTALQLYGDTDGPLDHQRLARIMVAMGAMPPQVGAMIGCDITPQILARLQPIIQASSSRHSTTVVDVASRRVDDGARHADASRMVSALLALTALVSTVCAGGWAYTQLEVSTAPTYEQVPEAGGDTKPLVEYTDDYSSIDEAGMSQANQQDVTTQTTVICYERGANLTHAIAEFNRKHPDHMIAGFHIETKTGRSCVSVNQALINELDMEVP